ncbi:MAG TPA: DUF3151 domain-containing protein [Streptosporangiales bacterium]
MTSERENLLASTAAATYLPDDAEQRAALDEAADPADVVKRYPTYSAAWAELADRAYAAGDVIASYAYARTGYHRGLDQLRGNGWRGQGPVPWEHEPNRGFLRALHALGRAAEAIGEDAEAKRCKDFLRESSKTAVETLGA